MIPAVLTLLVGLNPLVTGTNPGFCREIQQIRFLVIMTDSQEKHGAVQVFSFLMMRGANSNLDHPHHLQASVTRTCHTKTVFYQLGTQDRLCSWATVVLRVSP